MKFNTQGNAIVNGAHIRQTAADMEWYLSDHLGSTTLLINESGLEVERTEYYSYGQVQSGGLD
ncbi:hypothetical protein [Methanolobus sp. WCC5]|uniref:hypothetical protein n=1 Tax=Methanolobus sp. WCC5 TaxID=3125785 RepID=UPI003253E579